MNDNVNENLNDGQRFCPVISDDFAPFFDEMTHFLFPILAKNSNIFFLLTVATLALLQARFYRRTYRPGTQVPTTLAT